MIKFLRICSSKKGSFTVFITMVFAAVMILVWAVIWASGQQAIKSAAQNLGPLWGRSILAEFDIKLKDRYGLFGYYGNEFLVREKLNFYAGYTFESKKYIDFSVERCSMESYRLTELSNMEKQIGEVMAAGIKPVVISEEDESIGNPDRYISSRWIIEALPSSGQGNNISINSLMKQLKSGIDIPHIMSDAADSVYIFTFFKDYMNNRNLGRTYFHNEIEYIISGQLSDKKAKEKVYNYLLLLRNGMNLTYLYTCDEKNRAAMAVAETIAPGTPALAVHLIIMETWALMEARNDLKLLYDNKPVPIIKKDRNWALSLDNVMDAMDVEDGTVKPGSKAEKDRPGYIKPDAEEGILYDDYLKVFIAGMSREIKLLRIMDLIQINMKYLYCDYFTLKDYYTGLDFAVKVNGNIYEFTEEY